LFLDFGLEATPEVVSAMDEAIREAEQVVADADEKKKGKPRRPRKSDRKLPEHLPRSERIVDLPEDRREGLKLIGYDEVERLVWQPPTATLIDKMANRQRLRFIFHTLG
jgi:transposase